MTNARLRLAFASKGTNGNHVSPCSPLLRENVGNLPVPHTPPHTHSPNEVGL
jgi:hypothetical protein